MKDPTQDDVQYAHVMSVLQRIPECIGFHLCGAYYKNNTRKYGLLNQNDQEESTTQGIKKINLDQKKWVQDRIESM